MRPSAPRCRARPSRRRGWRCWWCWASWRPPCGRVAIAGDTMSAVIATHPAGRWLARFEAVPPLAWLALQAAALWPHWRWAAARVADGSDDPLGLAALAALAAVVFRLEPQLRASPKPAWLIAAMGA